MKRRRVPLRALVNAARNRYELKRGKTRLRSRPLELHIAANKTCNLKCIFCLRQVPEIATALEKIPSPERNLPFESLQGLKFLFPYPYRVNVGADGEPFLYNHIRELIDLCQPHGNLVFVTNGTLFSRDMADRVVRGQVTAIHFSIDSQEKATYEELRRGASFEGVIEGIERINAAKETFGSHYPELILRPSLMKRNVEELPRLVQMAAELKMAAVIVQVMQLEAEELKEESLFGHRELLAAAVEEAKKVASTRGVSLELDLPLRNLLSGSDADRAPEARSGSRAGAESSDGQRQASPGPKCLLPWRNVLIDTNGDVRFCCHANLVLGNITTDRWDDIWNGRQAQAVRVGFLAGGLPDGCRDRPCGVK